MTSKSFADNIRTGLTATGGDTGTLASALVIPDNQFVTVISTCADNSTTGSAGSGVSLPAAPYLYPKSYIVTNNGNGTLLVWPGAANSTIDGTATAGTAGTAVACCLPGQTKEFAATISTAWITIRTSDNGKAPAKTMTGTANLAPELLACESGLTINYVCADSERTIRLPAAAKGLKFKFVCGSAAGAGNQDLKIAAPADAKVIGGSILTTSGVAGSSVFGSATVGTTTGIKFEKIADGVKIGDTIDVVCADGTNWSVAGVASGTAAGISLTS